MARVTMKLSNRYSTISRTMTNILILSACIGFACNDSSHPPKLSDSEAKKVIEGDWKEDNNFRVYLGTFEVTRERGSDLSKHRISASRMSSYRTWEDVGLITVSLRKDLTKGFSGWDNWNKLFLEGVESVVHIEPTEKGMPMKKDPDEDGEHAYLLIPQGEFPVNTILRNEPLKLGIDDYRVILGTHAANYTAETKSYYEAIGTTPKAEKKFKALLKFDPFDSTWKVATQDIADRDSEFSSNNVNELLRSWGK